MEISKNNVTLQWLIIFCVCIFGCGAYFVFDSPACIQRYLMAAMGFTNQEYMSLYTWYSAPNVVTCILGGVLIDMIGRRMGGIIFCTVIFVGQLIYSYSISNSSMGSEWLIAACVGRTVIGAGVEAVAVCSNCYLTWWFEGSKLKPLAFGLALSIWRMSSSVSLVTMLPLYNNINTVTPQDGMTGIFSSCVYKGCEGAAFNDNFTNMFDNGNKEHTELKNYYCYDKELWSTCEYSQENAKSFIEGDKSFCKDWATPEVRTFVDQTRMMESFDGRQCMSRSADTTFFSFDEDLCKCLDSNYMPRPENQLAELTKWGGVETKEMAKPFYWSDTLGEFTSRDLFDTKFALYKSSKNAFCKKNYGIEGVEFDTFANFEVKRGEGETDEDYQWRSRSEREAAILSPKAKYERTVVSFMEMLASNEVFAKDCKKSAILDDIPTDHTDARIEAASTIYYYMLSVTLISVAMSFFLYKIDGQAEANFKKENNVSDEKPEPFTVKGLIDAFKGIPGPIFILFGMCICFYVGVFTFITQAPMFFEKHSGLSAQTATVAAGMVYILAVPCNPILGSIVAKVENEQVFLMSAFVISGLAHLVMLSFRHVLAAFFGMFLLAIAYAIIGTTMWPLVGSLVDQKIVGKVFGLMFATQQLGLTVAAIVAGWINDNMGWVSLELFFVILQAVGALGGFVLIQMIGRSTPKDKKEEASSEEKIPMNE